MSFDVTLIITVFNEINGIERWFSSLENQSIQPDEIVIVDGGSKDGTLEVLQEYFKNKEHVLVMSDYSCNSKTTNGPIARGRNVAIRNASNDFIIGTDAGCEMHEDFIRNMKIGFEDGGDFLCGSYDLKNPNPYQLKLQSSFIPSFNKKDFPQNFLPSSRSIGFHKTLWEKVGGYPEATFAGEDTWFAARLSEICNKPILVKDALVYWDSPRDRNELANKCLAYGFGDGFLLQNVRLHLVRFLIMIFPPLFLTLMVAKKRSFESWFIYYFSFVGFVKGITKRLL